MGNRAEYFLQADYCKKMADKAISVETSKRWLELAGKWLALADETYGNGVVEQFGDPADPLSSRA